MAIYKNFRYIYPPRPEYVVSPDQLNKYENDYVGQPKLNGSCCLIFIKGDEYKIYGRHGKQLSSFKLSINDIRVLNCNNENWNVIVGEYMNKNQKGIDEQPWNHKFVIFDILVHNGEYLLNSTLENRIELLDNLFGTITENDYLYKIDNNVFRVKTFYKNFLDTWKNITKVGMLEGFVLKKPNAKLQRGLSEKNNTLWQLKSRKPTKNYNY